METKQDLPILEFEDEEAWSGWLAENHDSARGIWLKVAKKTAPRATVSYAEALDAALCFGWIDGQKGRYDDEFWLQRFTPRGPRSRWSQVNREKAERLIAEGRMQPAGMAEVQQAQEDGRWDAAYPAQSAAVVPDDFQAALDANAEARSFFETLTGAHRYSFLYRLHQVSRPDARAKRIADYIELLSSRRTLRRAETD